MMDKAKQMILPMLLERGVELSDKQWGQLDQYFTILVEWNEKMNLTAITEREQVYVKHFYDSLSLSFYVDMKKTKNIADIGSGAGFPSIPLKIAFPHLEVTIVDSLNKRITFLRHLVDQLGLDKVTCVHSRAEDAARSKLLRDRFDLVTARAVARLNVLNELCLPFAKPDGLFAAMKGSQGEEELSESANSLRELKGKHVSSHSLELPMEDAVRHIIIVRKDGSTPHKYPRKAGIPLKQPLI
jgi:16S rRNA (guanine527-N7)-methyltransferase